MKAMFEVGDIVQYENPHNIKFISEIVRVEKHPDTYFYYFCNGDCCSERNILGYF